LEILHARTVSPSVHPRPASGGAADFFLASALRDHHQALRPAGVKDARCIRPISATQTKLRVPAPRVFPARSPAFAGGMPHGVFGSVRRDRGTGRFTTSRTASARPSSTRDPRASASRRRHEAWAFSSHGVDAAEPLTSLSRSLDHPRASPAFAGAACRRRRPLLAGGHGSEDAEERQDHP
jgi:hypothetical protein